MLVRNLFSYFRRWISIVYMHSMLSIDIASSCTSMAFTYQRSSYRHDLWTEQLQATVVEAGKESVRLHSLMNIHRLHASNPLNRYC